MRPRRLGISALSDVEVEHPTPDAAVVVVSGEHDLSDSEEFARLLTSIVDEHEIVVVDVSSAEFVDSSIVKALLDAKKAASESGRTFRVQLGGNANAQRLFEIENVVDVLDCVSTREEALARPRPE